MGGDDAATGSTDDDRASVEEDLDELERVMRALRARTAQGATSPEAEDDPEEDGV